uniref:Calcitonin peptide-like domain-containing protein n=1 Tax=Eptatretus burgeri TaxID=7764 RepID=A0A8C4R1N1_EPTBU
MLYFCLLKYHLMRTPCKASTCAIQRLVDLINRSGLSSTIPRTNVGSAAYGRRQVT